MGWTRCPHTLRRERERGKGEPASGVPASKRSREAQLLTLLFSHLYGWPIWGFQLSGFALYRLWWGSCSGHPCGSNHLDRQRTCRRCFLALKPFLTLQVFSMFWVRIWSEKLYVL